MCGLCQISDLLFIRRLRCLTCSSSFFFFIFFSFPSLKHKINAAHLSECHSNRRNHYHASVALQVIANCHFLSSVPGPDRVKSTLSGVYKQTHVLCTFGGCVKECVRPWHAVGEEPLLSTAINWLQESVYVGFCQSAPTHYTSWPEVTRLLLQRQT